MTTSNKVKTPQTFKEGTKVPEVKKNEAPGNWIAQKDKLKKKFGTLTDADLVFEEGKKDQMLAHIQAKIGKSKEELEAIIAAL